MDYASLAVRGFGNPDIALLIVRVLLGSFFVLARFRWFYDPSRPEHFLNHARHTHLSEKLQTCGFGNHPAVAALVAAIEVGAGLFLIVGLFTSLAALGLIAILLGAVACSTKAKTMKQDPVDGIQVAEDVLWTVEPLYLLIAGALLVAGGGAYSLDGYLF
jgi:uncharacterized membrane protein YphA (DoxX/SURF4 family)